MIQGNIFALDLGTTKFCLAALINRKGASSPTIEKVSVPARGMKRGMLANFTEAAEGIKQLIEVAEQQLACDVRSVVVGVAGSHLRGKRVSTRIALGTEPVDVETLRILIQNGEQLGHSAEREVLHTIPIGYRVDQRELIDNPVGFTGRLIEGEFFLIDADKHYLKDIIRLCNQCGLEVDRLYSEPFASASVSIEDHEKDLGVAIADIGGGTTDGIVFQSGKPLAAFTINIGGIMMTNDLAIGLNLSPLEAERVKVFFGLAPKTREAHLTVQDLFGKERILRPRDTVPILGARVYELAQFLARELLPFKGSLGAGVLLTGGGAEIQGVTQFMEQQYKVSVRKALPSLSYQTESVSQTDGSSPVHYPTKFATAFGLLNLEIGKRHSESMNRKKLWPSRYLNHFVNWVKELS